MTATPTTDPLERVHEWEKRSEWPLIGLAVAFLAAYAWPVLDPDIARDLRGFLYAVSWTVWVAFAFDLAVRVWLARGSRGRYLLSRWYDVAMVALPLLRPLRLLRLLVLLRLLDRTLVGTLAGKVATYVTATSAFAVGLGALAVLDAEQHADGANITSFGDALWWACVTATTVGYGDFYPVTFAGRVVAVALMCVGIGLIGTVTATIASVLVQRVESGESSS